MSWDTPWALHARRAATWVEEGLRAPADGEPPHGGFPNAPGRIDDATGTPTSLSQIVQDGPAVIVFYRGGWCPYCNLALRTYQRELLPQLVSFGARLVAISPQTPDQSLSTAEKAGLAFTVLSDPGSRVARSVGIAFQQADDVLAAQRQLGLDLAQVNAEGSVQLPRPTVLIVDQDQTVRFVDVQPDYTARTEVADIFTALTGIRNDHQ